MEGVGPKIEKKVLQGVNKLLYMNVNGLMSSRLEVEELLEREKPDMLVLTETKWKDEWGDPEMGKGKYDCWMKNRRNKAGGGVMILIKKNIGIDRVEISENNTEIVKVVVRNPRGEERSYMGVYVPPLSNAWTRREYDTMVDATKREMEETI